MVITIKYKGHFNHLVVITVGILQPTVRYICGLNINFMRKYLLISLIIVYCYNALDCYNLTPLGCLYVMFSGTTGGSYFQDCLQFFIYFIFNTQTLWNLVVKNELIVCNS